jgi:hypothetical protein
MKEKTSRQFRNKNREYVKENELPTNSKNKNSIRKEIN